MIFDKIVDFTQEAARKERREFAEWLSALSQSDKVRQAAAASQELSEEARVRWAEASEISAEVMAELSEQEDVAAAIANIADRLEEISTSDPKLEQLIAAATFAILRIINFLSGPESVEPVRRRGPQPIVE